MEAPGSIDYLASHKHLSLGEHLWQSEDVVLVAVCRADQTHGLLLSVVDVPRVYVALWEGNRSVHSWGKSFSKSDVEVCAYSVIVCESDRKTDVKET